MAHVLVVESAPRLGPILQNWPEGLEIDPTLRVTVCHAPVAAYATLREGPVELLVLSAIDAGPDLLGILVVCAAHHPTAKVLVISPIEPPTPMRVPDGAVTFVLPDLDSLFDALEGALRGAGDGRTLEDVVIDELVLLALLSRWSGTLHARTARRSGYIGVHQGTIVDARFGELRGERALVEFLAQSGGTLVAGPFDRATATATLGVSLRSDLAELRSRIDVRRDLLAQAPDAEPDLSASDIAHLVDDAEYARSEGPSIFDADELAELEEMARDVDVEGMHGRRPSRRITVPVAAVGPSLEEVASAVEAMRAAGFAWVVIADAVNGQVLGGGGDNIDVSELEASTTALVRGLAPLAQTAGGLRELSIAGPVGLRLVGRGLYVAVGSLADGAPWLVAQGVARQSLASLLDGLGDLNR